VLNFVEIDSAVIKLCMREMSRFRVDFLRRIYPSNYPFLLQGYGSQFWGDFNA